MGRTGLARPFHATCTRWTEATDDQDIAAVAAGVLAELRATTTTLS